MSSKKPTGICCAARAVAAGIAASATAANTAKRSKALCTKNPPLSDLGDPRPPYRPSLRRVLSLEPLLLGFPPGEPAAKHAEQRRLGLGGEVVGRDPAGHPDRRPQLGEVVGALAAAGEMLLEPAQVGRLEGALEVVRDELDELLATDGVGDRHSLSGAR